MFKVYGEELDFVFTEVRKKGCRQLIIDGKPVDISAEDLRSTKTKVRDMDAVVDRFVVGRKHEKAIKAGIAATLLVGDGLMQVEISKGASKAEAERFYKASAARRTTSSTAASSPSTSCSTIRRAPAGPAAASASTRSRIRNCWCPIPKRSIRGGCFVREAFKYNPDTWDGRVMYSLSKALEVLARHAVGEAARDGAPRDPLRARRQKTADLAAARSEGQTRRIGRQGGRLRRDRPPHRAALPPLPAARRGQLRDGSVARQGDGGAHLPRLQRRAPARHAAAVHHRRQDHPRRRRISTSTSCTRSSARSSPPAAARMPAGRC